MQKKTLAKYFFCNAKIATTRAIAARNDVFWNGQKFLILLQSFFNLQKDLKFIESELWLYEAPRKDIEE